MKKKLFCKMFMFFLVLSFFWLGAVTESSAYTKDDIGQYLGDTTPGDAVAGMQVYCDGKLLCYAFDVWNYSTSAGWKYVSTNVDGSTLSTPYHQNNGCPVWMRKADTNTVRFEIMIPNLKNRLEDRKYSIVIDRYFRGVSLGKIVETPYDADEDLYAMYSLQKYINEGATYAGYGSFYERCPSFIFNLYKILEIGPEAEIHTGGEGYLLDRAGEAYYDGSDYIIHSLPEITPKIEGYQCSLQGWYDKPEGGNQYYPGDRIQASTVLYPHWNKVALKYPVNCIDVIGDSSSGTKLGESSWNRSMILPLMVPVQDAFLWKVYTMMAWYIPVARK